MSVTDGRLRTAPADHYQLERELGDGGVATVYPAHDILRPELAAGIGADRFLTEIKTTANLQHPYNLPLHVGGGPPGATQGCQW